MVDRIQEASQYHRVVILSCFAFLLGVVGLLCSCGNGKPSSQPAAGEEDSLPPPKILSEADRAKYMELRGQGVKEYYNKNSAEALKLLTEAQAINPGDPNVYNDIGIVYHQLKQYNNATAIFEKGIRIDPYVPVLHMNLGLLYDETGDFEKAAKELTQVTQLNPGFFEAHRRLGDIYYKTQKFEEAVEQYRKAVKLNPNDVDAYLGIGNILFKQKKYQEAIEPLQVLLKVNPNYPDAHYKLGQIFRAVGNTAKAEEHMAAFKKISEYQEEIDALERELDQDPKNVDKILFMLGMKYGEHERWSEAIEMLDRLVKIQPENAKAHHFLSVGYGRMRQPDKAVAESQQAIKLDPKDHRFHYQLGYLFVQMNRVDDAIASFQQAADLKGDDLHTLMSLGSLLKEKKQYARAAGIFEKVISLDPKSVPAHDMLLDIYGWADEATVINPGKALALAAEAEKLGSKNYLALAKAYDLNGQSQKARAILKGGLATLKSQGAPAAEVEKVERYLTTLK